MNKKILYVINHIDWFWSHRLPLAKGAQDNGWDVHLAVTGASVDQELTKQGFHGSELPPSDQGFMPLTILKTIYAIHKTISRERPSLVHAITLKYAFLAGLAVRLHKDVRVIHTLAGLGYLFSGEGLKPKILRTLIGPLLKISLKHPRAQLIFQNPDDQALMLKRGFARPEQCTLILGSGVDTSAFAATPIPQSDEPPIILMPTRLVHDKGIAIFIEAARLVKAQGHAARFQIAGGITHNNPLAITQKEMEAMTKDSAVQWLGKVDDMPALLQRASLICYPSYYGEGVPKVLLEACACARPIITTDHPGCREAVKHGENGLLVPIKDPNACADAIIALIKDHNKMQGMGENGRTYAEKQFDVHLIVDKTLALYQTS